MDVNNQYFDCLCRTCMNEVEESSYDGNTKPQRGQSIFDRIEECDTLRIAELLSKAVPHVEVKQTDELPKQICCECLQKLLTVYQFQQMCIQSEEQLRELVSIKGTDIKREAAMESDVEAEPADSSTFKNFCDSSPLQNSQHPSIQESVTETTKIIEPEIIQPIVADHFQNNDQLLELCKYPQDDFSGFVKNEPINDDAHHIEYSDSGTMHSIISVTKDEVFSIESEEQQVNVTSSPYKERNHLNRHLRANKIKANSKKSDHACELCGEKYSSRRSLAIHSKQKHSTDKAKIKNSCSFCDKSFKDKHKLRHHERTHTGERPHLCPECGQAFSIKENLQRHRIALHINNKPSECSNKTIHESKSEKRNLKRSRPSDNIDEKVQLYECPYCPVKFRSDANMSRHIAMHEGRVKKEACDICGKKFRKSDLKRHKETHNDEKAFKCDFCEKRFRLSSLLRAHIRTHTGEKPFECKYCGRRFATCSTRVQHLRTHLGYNVHRCEYCPSAFRLRSQLRAHITTHKNEDPETRERNLKALKEEEAKLERKLSKNKPSIICEGNAVTLIKD